MGTGPHVRIIVEHVVVREVALRPPMTFGRSEDNDVVLADKTVSAHHGRVEHSEAGWTFLDCGSIHGTPVAGARRLVPGERVDLESGTQLKLGRTVLDFQLGEAADPRLSPLPAGTTRAAPRAQALDPATLRPRLLEVTDSGVHVHLLPMPVATIGRADECDVVLKHASVSAKHAEVSWVGDGWTVRDLGSTNGTRVGLIPLTEARLLVNAAHLIVGDVDLLFLHGGEEGAIDADELLASLQRRGGLSRRDARQALDEHARTGRDVEEILMDRQLLGPGSLYEMRHDALHGTIQEATPNEPGAVSWVVLVAALAAIAWLLFR